MRRQATRYTTNNIVKCGTGQMHVLSPINCFHRIVRVVAVLLSVIHCVKCAKQSRKGHHYRGRQLTVPLQNLY